MLINESKALVVSEISKIIAQSNGNSEVVKKLQTGVYLRGDFGNSNFLKEYDCYPKLKDIGSYGVCDNIENLLNKCKELELSDIEFVIMLTEVDKYNQPEEGGWRWHKWGEYIGSKNPKFEYLYDEEDIDIVYCYSIYEKI